MNNAELKKTLGIARGTALMLNIVLGAGLLTLPGLAYREIGSDAIWLWLASAFAAVPLLVVFAIAGRRFSDAGGIPALAGRILGRQGYTVSTFLFLGAVILGLPAIAITGGYYASGLVGASPYLLAAGIVVVATGVNFLSAETAGRVNGAIATLLLLFLIGIAIFGGLAVYPPSEAPPISVPALDHDRATYAGAFLMVFFAFTGWEVAVHLSEEFRNPQRDVPRAMALSFLIAVALYIGLAFIVAASGLTARFEAPFTSIFSDTYGAAAGRAIAGFAVLLIFANLSAATWAVSRMVFSASRERLFPRILAGTTNGTPRGAVLSITIVLLVVIALAGAGLLPLHRLLEFAGQNFLILYGVAAIAVFRSVPLTVARLASGLSILLVFGIMSMREPAALAYPLALAALGIIAAQRAGTKEVEAP